MSAVFGAVAGVAILIAVAALLYKNRKHTPDSKETLNEVGDDDFDLKTPQVRIFILCSRPNRSVSCAPFIITSRGLFSALCFP